MATSSAGGEDLTREERKEEYERVLSIIKHNTGGEQPPMASRTSITQIASQAGITKPTTRLRAAIDNGDVMRWLGKVCLTEEDALVAVIEHEREQKHTQHRLISKANHHLQDQRGGNDD